MTGKGHVFVARMKDESPNTSEFAGRHQTIVDTCLIITVYFNLPVFV